MMNENEKKVTRERLYHTGMIIGHRKSEDIQKMTMKEIIQRINSMDSTEIIIILPDK